MNINSSHNSQLNRTEELLLDLWATILEKSEIGIDDDFDEMGGTSVTLANLFVAINQKFPNTITLNDLFINRTVRKIALMIDGNQPVSAEARELEF